MSPSAACDIPPGRQWALDNCDPSVPGPQWDRFVSSGKWPKGIEKGLDETAACHVNRTIFVKRGGGELERHDNVNIPGFFPWGWYDVVRATPPAPPEPEQLLERYDGEELDPRTPGVVGGASDADVSLKLPELAVEADPAVPPSCITVPVPTIDLLHPYPENSGSITLPNGTSRQVLAGDLGRLVIRLPGSDHPMFSSGIALCYIAREFLSELGLFTFNAWDSWRRTASPSDPAFNRYRELLYLRTWLGQARPDLRTGLSWIPIEWTTRDYSATHMQCPRNHFPSTPTYEALGVSGQEVERRWQLGGDSPAPYVGDGWDTPLERYSATWVTGPGGDATPVLSERFLPIARELANDPSGTPYALAAPEHPFGHRDAWSSGARTLVGWSGPPPGALLA